jgi:hypothetical protein
VSPRSSENGYSLSFRNVCFLFLEYRAMDKVQKFSIPLYLRAYRVWYSHSCGYEKSYLLVCNTMLFVETQPMFRRNISPPKCLLTFNGLHRYFPEDKFFPTEPLKIVKLFVRQDHAIFFFFFDFCFVLSVFSLSEIYQDLLQNPFYPSGLRRYLPPRDLFRVSLLGSLLPARKWTVHLSSSLFLVESNFI